jgi:hypothetical protein
MANPKSEAEVRAALMAQGGESLVSRDWKKDQLVQGSFNGYRYDKRPQDKRATPFIKIGDKEYAVTDLLTGVVDKSEVKLGDTIAVLYMGKEPQKKDASKTVHVFKMMKL